MDKALEYEHRSALKQAPDLVNFVPAVAYLFCLALPTASTKPKVHLLAKTCIDSVYAGCQFLTDLCAEWLQLVALLCLWLVTVLSSYLPKPAAMPLQLDL